MDPLFEIDLDLAASDSRATSQSLYRQLKAAIVDGRLRSGSKLPATRKSRTFFGVSRNTVVDAYERLRNEGYVAARQGAGTYVADAIPSPARRPSPSSEVPPDYRLNEFWLRSEVTEAMSFWRDTPEKFASRRAIPRHIDFRPALIDSSLFPFDVYRRVSAKQLRNLEQKPARYKSAQGNQGNYHLRDAITKHIALTRAVVCQPDDIVVTAGAQQAFDLLARVLVTPGQTVVAIEDPGYPPMRVAFAAAGAKLVPVEVDAEGLMVERLPPEVGVICVCPSHQFPLGVTMSMRRRKSLLEFARSRGAVIIEDDYDGEFRHDGSPLEALRARDATDVVFYVGTFSKCMLPALRLGFVVAPKWSMRTVVAAKNCLDWHCSIPVQIAVAAFIADGHLAHHVRKMRQTYKKRRELLLSSLQERFAKWLEPLPSLYGMHVTVVARAQLDLDVVAATALRHNVKIHTLGRYYLGQRTRDGLVFGYAAVDLSEMSRGLSILRRAVAQ